VASELDLPGYRAAAETFYFEVEREHYLQGSGQKAELELEPIYARHAGLFSLDRVARFRAAAQAAGGETARGLRNLGQFALDGLLEAETRPQVEEVARLESSLEVEVGGRSIPYRQVVIEQSNEPDPRARAELAEASDRLLASRINPLLREALDRSHAICRELGWDGYAAAYEELRGLGFEALGARVAKLMRATRPGYADVLAPQLERAGLPPFDQLSRADIARFRRAGAFDDGFDRGRLTESFGRTLSGLGIELSEQRNVHLDIEPRPTKSPRAFCSPLRVPAEVYLVIAPSGGREDYAALMHEGGHTEHYANVSDELAFEHRYLGDNAVTESFAFLFEHLIESPAWLEARLGISEPQDSIAYARALRLLFVRRYAAKLVYERELHAAAADLDAMPGRYAELLCDAVGVDDWPSEQWLADVDQGFYVVCYLRAWALEIHWRRALEERFGVSWFDRPEAGRWLRELWREGQRLPAEELLAKTLGEQLDFAPLAAELLG
jgi:hypothetical protein